MIDDRPLVQLAPPSRAMTVDLVFPPLTGITYPYLSTAALAGYVHSRSAHRVRQVDLNLAFVEHLLEPERLQGHITAAAAAIEEMDTRRIDGAEQLAYGRCAALLRHADAIATELEPSLAVLRDATAGAAALTRARTVFGWALNAATALRPPEVYDLTEPVYRYASGSSAELRAGALHPDNGFHRFFDQHLKPSLLTGDVVGISLVYRGQMLPALALAAWLRQHRPRAKVLVGGPLLTALRTEVLDQPWLFDLVDGVALYEGESALLEYLDLLGAGVDRPEVANMITRGPDGQPRSGSRVPPVPAAELPTPDFGDLPLDRYLAPEVTLPLLASRGCYWRCAFCTHHHIYGDTYRPRPRPAIIDDLATLKARHHCEAFYFVDESISPPLLRHLSASIVESGLEVSWGCELRMEKSLAQADIQAAASAGCRVFTFGMESANQRVLDLMNKGVSRADVERVLRQTSEAGIAAHIMCIIGFPGETSDEARETMAFVDEHAALIDLVGFSYFCLNRNAPVQQQPERYGLQLLRPLVPGHDFEERLAYDVSSGLSRGDAFDLWLEAISAPAVRTIERRVGHNERERYLYGPSRTDGRPTLAPTPGTAVPTPRLWTFGHDISAADEAERDFWAAASWGYNVTSTSVRESWLRHRQDHHSDPAPCSYLDQAGGERAIPVGDALLDALRALDSDSPLPLSSHQLDALRTLRELATAPG